MADSSTLASKIDRQRAIEREEHAAAVQRLRTASTLGLLLWPLFGALDLLVDAYIAPGSLRQLLALRAIGLVFICFAWLRLRYGAPPEPRMLRAVDFLTFTLLCWLISLQALHTGGPESPLATGIIVVMVGRTIASADPWRRGLVHYGAMALCFPLTMALAALVNPTTRGVFGDGRAVALFLLHGGFIFGTCLTLVLTDHVLWKLRRRSFEERNVGRYRLLRRVGAGGMGEVWVAQHQGLRREVALKILRLGPGASRNALPRFEREVLVTSELTHPNTIRIMDYGATPEGIWYYAMELLDGCDLKTLVRTAGPLPPARALHLLRQACGSLGEAHQRGLVHRDVKPENLFITQQGGEPDFIKVLDFGIVGYGHKRRSQDRAERAEPPGHGDHGEQGALTVAGGVVGTPLYLSPEAARGQPTDARSDVYALGAVLYYLLCGRPPFEGPEWVLLRKHAEEEPPPPSRLRGAPVGADLEEVVLRCLSKDPARRYADASELGRALDRCAEAGRWAAAIRARAA